MFSQIAISNIINNVLSNNTFLNLCSNNLFSLSLSNLDSYNLIKLTSMPFIGIINDDPIGFSQKVSSLQLQYHTQALLFIHNNPPAALKKEDKYILSQKLNNTTKVFFDENIKKSWGLSDKDCHTIPYGVESKNPIKTKDIVVLNPTNNSNIIKIYQYIKNLNNNVDLLTSPIDYNSCIDLIGQYKIAICLDNSYDALLCSALRCRVISNIDLDNKFHSTCKITDYNHIMQTISKFLDRNDTDDIDKTIEHINLFYKLDIFMDSIKLILSNFQHRAYVHEA
jgi:hypothetical protein